MNECQLKELICEIGRRIYAKGFAAANDGNITVRLNEREFLCTPTMISKGYMKPEDICKVDLEGKQLAGTRQRSSEALLHLAIYKQRPDVNAIVHCHPPHATAFAVAHEPIPKCVLAEVEVYLGEVPMAKYETPGNHRFAETVVPFVKDCNTLILANHGTVTFGPDLEKAYWNTEIIDAYCRILILARQLGRVNYFDEEKTKELLDLKKRLGYDDVRFRKPTENLSGDSSFDKSYSDFVPHAYAFVREEHQTQSATNGTISNRKRRPMFSYRHDKVGFFSGLTLMFICAGTFIATLVLLIVGAALGDWKMFFWPIRWVLLGWWLGCIATVLTRVYIMGWQLKRERQQQMMSSPPPSREPVAASVRESHSQT